MARPPFTFEIDGLQWRQATDRIGMSAGGLDFQTGQYFSNVILDSLTNTVMLAPVQASDSWYNSATLPYDKLGLADFGSPAGWVLEDTWGNGASKFLCATNTAGGRVITTTSTWAINTGFYVGAYGYTDNGAVTKLFECGWNDASGITAETAIRVYTDGSCEVWRNNALISTGQLSGVKGGAKLNGLIECILLPCRHRELLVISTAGNVVRGIMPDIAEDETYPKITSSTAQKFWVRGYGTIKVQVAPLRYQTSGYICSQEVYLAEAPPVGATMENYTNNASFLFTAPYKALMLGDTAYRKTGGTFDTSTATFSLVKTDGTTAFVPDGTLKVCRMRIDFSAPRHTGGGGDGYNSPTFIYGLSGGYASTIDETDDSEKVDFSMVEAVQHLSLQVPETGGPEISLGLFNPDQLGITGLYDHDCKPLKVTLGTTVIHQGITKPVDFTQSTTADSDKAVIHSDPLVTQLLKAYAFRERMVFDGMLVSHHTDDCIIKRLVALVGGSATTLDLETSTVRAGDIAPAVCGEFTVVADIGENAWDFLCRIMQDNLGGWWYGEYPGATEMKFKTLSPATINGATVKKTYYASTADAIAAGVAADEAWRSVYRQLRSHRIRPEANEVIVSGYDPRFQYPVQAVQVDAASIDPTTAPSARPSNWMGMRARLGVINKGIGSQAIATAGAGILFDRVSPSRSLTEIEIELPVTSDVTGFPLWVTDRITLDGVGDFIITSMSAEAEKDPDPGSTDEWMWRPATLVLSNIIGYSTSTHYEDVKAWATANTLRQTLMRRNSIPGSPTLIKPGSLEIIP